MNVFDSDKAEVGLRTSPVPEWLRARLRAWDMDSLVERISVVDAEGAFPSRHGDNRFHELLRGSVFENMGKMRSFLLGDLDLASLELHEPTVFARKQAEVGSSPSALQRSYRLGVQVAIREWGAVLIDEATRQEQSAAAVADALLGSVLRILEYGDFVQTLVAAEFAQQETELRLTGQQVREQIVRDLVAREDAIRTADYVSILGYDLSGGHLAFEIDNMSTAEASEVAHGLRRAMGATGLLALASGVNQSTFWLGRSPSWSQRQVAGLRQELQDRNLLVSVARPAGGVDGLRQSYAEIEEMRRLRVTIGAAERVLFYPDVRLELLLFQDKAATRRFIDDELGPMAADSATAERLRETVAAAYVHGSHVQTANALGVHEHTVRNRLRRAEELLGHSLAERRAEVQIALRLRESARGDSWSPSAG